MENNQRRYLCLLLSSTTCTCQLFSLKIKHIVISEDPQVLNNSYPFLRQVTSWTKSAVAVRFMQSHLPFDGVPVQRQNPSLLPHMATLQEEQSVAPPAMVLPSVSKRVIGGHDLPQVEVHLTHMQV